MGKNGNLLNKNERERKCSVCGEVLEESFFGEKKELLCKSCYVDLQLEKAKREPTRKFCFSNRTINFRTHFCTNGQGFNLEVKSSDILDKSGRILEPEKISFEVFVFRDGFYEKLVGEKIEEKLSVTTTFFNDGNIFVCGLKIPILTDEEGNFTGLGEEDGFEKVILSSEEFVGRGMHFKK